MNRAEYDAKLHRLIEIESDHSIKKTPADYKLRGKFDILSVDVEGTIVKKLVKKGTQLRYVCKEVVWWDLCSGRGFVQWQLNSRHHTGIGRSPYKATFGTEPRLGLRVGLDMPDEVIDKINDELDLADLAFSLTGVGSPTTSTENAQKECVSCGKPYSGSHKCHKCNKFCHAIPPCSTSHSEEGFGASVTCHHCSKEAETNSQQEAAKENQMAQADRMLQRSARQLAPLKVGSSVMVPIPEVDRGRAEFPNVKGIVMEVRPCREAFLSVENVPDKTVSLRTAANSSAMGSGQGTFKCGCKQKCNSTRCKCFKSKLKCNSKCHSSMPCDNKHE
ncbi:KRAB-A domain-containing protein 2-like [Ditylenchus destructor]|uniref:KRAB-A domain-containing protein 2-like n=1 Tax=Ditylenchus destructor TaxID=166010 RepID=A0AAD4NB00_9BILA|nr:KRAB-A domain-containing protein 2-like [Ditylenchus destructor]